MATIEEKFKERIDEILSLKPDWDGYGVTTIEKSTIDKALKLIPKMEAIIKEKYGSVCEVDFGPRPDGGIDLDWKCADYEVLLGVPPRRCASRLL